MGQAKRRGTFEERRQQAIAKRAALISATPPKPETERPVVAMPRHNLSVGTMMITALAQMALNQGVYIIRKRG